MLVVTGMCCVAAWHRLVHPYERLRLIRQCGAGIEDIEKHNAQYWLFSGLKIPASEKWWAAGGWNRGNLAVMLEIVTDKRPQDLPSEYWQSLRQSAFDLFRLEVEAQQESRLGIKTKRHGRTSRWMIVVPLWSAWIAISTYPLLAISRPLVRRSRRRRRGLCIFCGYDLRGNPALPCSECGAKPTISGTQRT